MKTETTIHLNKHRDEHTINASGFEIKNDEHGYVERGCVVVKAETEDQKVAVFLDVEDARELRKALDRAIRKADRAAAREENFKRRSAKWAKRDAAFRERQIAAGRMNPDGTWKEVAS